MPVTSFAKKQLKLVVMSAAVLTLAACANMPKLAPAGPYATKSYTVNLASDWNAIAVKTDKGKPATLLTKDGIQLNSVYLFSNIKPGDAILKERRKENPVPKYDDDMLDLELVEFLTDSLAKGQGMVGLTATNIRPESFNGQEAIRFDLIGTTPSGLRMEGESIMSAGQEGLNIILFLAPSEHYAGKVQNDVDAIFDSVSRGNVIT